MLIAIDESGDFRPQSEKTCIFAAVQLWEDADLLDKKREQFENWKSGLGSELQQEDGEVKGASLSDSDLADFVEHVVWASPFLVVSGSSVVPKENDVQVVASHKRLLVASAYSTVEDLLKEGRTDEASHYKDLAGWLHKLNHQLFLKQLLLGDCIGEVLRFAFLRCAMENYSQEIRSLRLLIDKDFVRGERNRLLWSTLAKQQIRDMPEGKPMPVRTEWYDEGANSIPEYFSGGTVDFGALFHRRCLFDVSRDRFELQIADIVSTILYRFLNYETAAHAFFMLRRSIMREDKSLRHALLLPLTQDYLNRGKRPLWHPPTG